MSDKKVLTPEEEAKVFMDTMKAEMSVFMDETKAEAAKIISDAKAEAEEIRSSGFSGTEPKVTLSSDEARAEAYNAELVEVELFMDDGKYKDDVTVAVNGKLWVIKRGYPVMIPRFVKAVLDNSKAQDKEAARYSERKQAEAQDRFKQLG